MSKLKWALLCFALLLILPFGLLAQELPAAELPAGYAPVAQSDRWTLYLKEANMGLIMQDKLTGRYMMSTVENPQDYRDNDLWKGFYQSGIVLEYIEGNINKYPWANLVSTEHTKEYSYLENGFDCRVSYTALGISYTAQVRLSGNDVSVSIPQELIEEQMPQQYTVGSFYVYPFMGYTYMGESGGYILIPDGQGALIDLKDNEGRYSSPYRASIYGTNIGLTELTQGSVMGDVPMNNPPERVSMPVYGIRHADSELAFLSVIESGDISATIQANLNGVGNMGFDWAGVQYTYRVVYPQSTGPSSGTINMRTPRAKAFDIIQHFRFLSGEQADYAGMAVSYRDYLTQTGGFAGAPADKPFGMQLDFLGADHKNGLIGTENVVMTTAAQAQEILTRLNDQSVVNTLSVFKGWGDKGYSGGAPTKDFKPAGSLGGRDALSKLFDAAAGFGGRVYLEVDPVKLNPSTAGSLVYSALKKVDSNTFMKSLYAWVYPVEQVLIPQKTQELAEVVSEAFAKAGVPGASLTGLTQLVTDYMHRQVYYDAGQTAQSYETSALTFAGKMPTVLQSPNAYLWGTAEALTNLPVAGSDYAFTSREVPFMAIALSGKIPAYAEYTNFQANTRQFFLRLVEQGLRPAFLLTWEDPILLQETNLSHIYSSRFELYEELIVQWHTQLAALHEQIQGASIMSHSVTGDVVVVGYSNGISLLINQSLDDRYYEGELLEAQSYKVVNAQDAR